MLIQPKTNKYFRCSCKPRVEFGKCNNLDHPLKLEWITSSYSKYIECWALGKYTLKHSDINKYKIKNKIPGRLKYGQLIHDYKYLDSTESKDESIVEILKSVKYFLTGYFPGNFVAFDAILPIPPTSPKSRTIPFEISKELSRYGLKNCKDFINVTNKAIKPSKDLKTKPEKIANLQGKFVIGDAGILNGVTGILVIDDVYEQGATAEVILELINDIAPNVPKYFLSVAYLD
jgi:predicted amidophosphoribosyltransferase